MIKMEKRKRAKIYRVKKNHKDLKSSIKLSVEEQVETTKKDINETLMSIESFLKKLDEKNKILQNVKEMML